MFLLQVVTKYSEYDIYLILHRNQIEDIISYQIIPDYYMHTIVHMYHSIDIYCMYVN